MGNDSGVRRKHRQRTTIHKKHVAYPGMRHHPDTEIVHGSIKLKTRPTPFNIKDAPTKKGPTDSELWDTYSKWAKQLGVNGSAAALAMRNTIEFNYSLAGMRLRKAKQLYNIKQKYRFVGGTNKMR